MTASMRPSSGVHVCVVGRPALRRTRLRTLVPPARPAGLLAACNYPTTAALSAGPERAYRSERTNTSDDAVKMLRAGAARGRYEPHLTEIFITDVVPSGGSAAGGS